MKYLKYIQSVMFLADVGIIIKISLLLSVNGRRYLTDYMEYKRQAEAAQPNFSFGENLPCLRDYSAQSAHLPQHYFYQDLFIANKIF